MKWLYLWFAYVISKPFGREFGEEIGASIFSGILFLFGMIILWHSKIGQKARFKISLLILLLPYLGKFAFNYGFRNFPPGSEPTGFRGIQWGTEFSSAFSEFKKAKEFKTDARYDGLLKSYFIENDDLNIALAELETVEYAFWGGIFSGVSIRTKDYENWIDLKSATFEKFGRGFQPDTNKEKYMWQGKMTTMWLEYDENYGKGALFMNSQKLIKEMRTWYKQKIREAF